MYTVLLKIDSAITDNIWKVETGVESIPGQVITPTVKRE